MNAKCNGVKALMTSRPNLSILGIAARHVNDVLHYAQNNWPKGSVAIISNHYEQNRLNKALFSSHESVSAIDTLGRFQGSQADVVILTLASIHPGFFTEKGEFF